MNKITKRTFIGINLIGLISAFFIVTHLIVSFYIGDEADNSYTLGLFFVSLILTTLSFGCAKIMDMICEIHEKSPVDE